MIMILMILANTITSQAQSPATEEHSFGPFTNSTVVNDLLIIPVAKVTFGTIQLSPDTADTDLRNRAGGAFFKKPFKLWEDDERLASFNTCFVFNVFRINNSTAGEGLAFVIAPDPSIPSLSDGQYLGLTNSGNDGDPSNQIVAIEFDTVKQDFDPDDNHVGLDIHTVKSNITVSLSKFGFQIAPNGTRFYVVWVEYHGVKKVIDVYMAVQPEMDAPIVEKPKRPVLTRDNLDLRGLVNQKSYFGFSASTGEFYELNSILRWNLSVEVIPESKSGKIGLGAGVGVGASLLVLVVVGISGVAYYLRNKKRASGLSDPKLLITLRRLPGTAREFRFRELKKATNNFDEKQKLGQGGFGVVYRGTLLPKENLEVAVKKFSRDSTKSIHDFLAELTIINRLRHKNLLRLLGWCHKNGVLLLVYEYMPNGSLDKHIFLEDGATSKALLLSWHLRYNIITGVASALHYLHNEYDQKVVHRDLKASNIMLDSDFNARLGDFGLARALENGKTSYAELEGVPGTRGYIAPECLYTGKATCESDVYGFGAVLLEVVCGQRPWAMIEGYHFLVDWVWYLHGEGRILEAVDPILDKDYVAEEAERVLKLGLACSHPIACKRPKMQAIVQIISGSVPMPHVPPFKPAFVWPAVVDVGGGLECDPQTTATFEYTPINTHSFAR